MNVCFHTFGCKANQYDTERMRQELESRGAVAVAEPRAAEVCVVNTCTVTNEADAEAKRFIRRLHRGNPGVRIVVVGCSAALRAAEYQATPGVHAVVEGHDPLTVAEAAAAGRPLLQLSARRPGPGLLARRSGGTRAWLRLQDGCDRKCSFCATRLARGANRSRPADEVVAEARLLARFHPEIVLTGIHIGGYGREVGCALALTRLVERLVAEVSGVRFRLSSIEATEVDDGLVRLMENQPQRLAPHFHMPLQSGSDRVLQHMRRWYTHEQYRRRVLDIAERLPVLGLGADVIVGFPGETDDDHARTRALIEELPYTYLHVFPFSPKQGTYAATLRDRVPRHVAALRGRELRALALEKGRRYRARRVGTPAHAVLESGGSKALTEDYLRAHVRSANGEGAPAARRVAHAVLHGDADHLYIDLSLPGRANFNGELSVP
ncbi:MAG: MiaB/RimO family radical SAM methylthiotransferase [Gemmatimonadetes bacterium]|nr:MiaB/RimO family radical SAM methylthiotransferase [Gemmatimonadota bacterium]